MRSLLCTGLPVRGLAHEFRLYRGLKKKDLKKKIRMNNIYKCVYKKIYKCESGCWTVKRKVCGSRGRETLPVKFWKKSLGPRKKETKERLKKKKNIDKKTTT